MGRSRLVNRCVHGHLLDRFTILLTSAGRHGRRRRPGSAIGERLRHMRGRLTPRRAGSSAKPLPDPSSPYDSASENGRQQAVDYWEDGACAAFAGTAVTASRRRVCQTAALSSREPVEAANSGPLARPPWYVSIASEVRPQDTTVFLQAVQEDDDEPHRDRPGLP